ncbi:membrane protein [Candidatus Francisella endociliophora]|uniref:Membrane protein n=1 Tax=Candidatus Francisella endociliophora TaxID=653937 RepID=A0A097ELX9_9GAMM|nr:hypothetical protein [Francisella sp. FSC1006]AIT08575.1 membrane protein [Francisella sp. FSC1006]
MQLEIKKSRKYRTLVYFCLVFITSCIIGAYFHNNMLLYLGFFLIFLSIFFELRSNKLSIDAIILPGDPDENSLKFIIDDKESDFWLIKKHIIINGWIYLYAIQQGSNKKIKIWLHKSNFMNINHIRDLAKQLMFGEK